MQHSSRLDIILANLVFCLLVNNFFFANDYVVFSYFPPQPSSFFSLCLPPIIPVFLGWRLFWSECLLKFISFTYHSSSDPCIFAVKCFSDLFFCWSLKLGRLFICKWFQFSVFIRSIGSLSIIYHRFLIKTWLQGTSTDSPDEIPEFSSLWVKHDDWIAS